MVVRKYQSVNAEECKYSDSEGMRYSYSLCCFLFPFFFSFCASLPPNSDLCDLFDVTRYPPVGWLCDGCHGGHSSDLQHPLHRHLRLQLGPEGRRGRDGRAAEPDRASPPARSSQGTAFISKFTLLSVRCKADSHTVSGAGIGRTKCRVFRFPSQI